MSLRKILEEVYYGGKITIVNGIGGAEVRDKYIDLAHQQILALLPKKKQVRYEDTKRQMGLDGKIIETEKNIRYDREDEAFNQAISDMEQSMTKER